MAIAKPELFDQLQEAVETDDFKRFMGKAKEAIRLLRQTKKETKTTKSEVFALIERLDKAEQQKREEGAMAKWNN
jgi:hypothetical protein